jgi:hypothetical protein
MQYILSIKFPKIGWCSYETYKTEAMDTVALSFKDFPHHILVTVFHEQLKSGPTSVGDFIKVIAVTRDGNVNEFKSYEDFKQYLIDIFDTEFDY